MASKEMIKVLNKAIADKGVVLGMNIDGMSDGEVVRYLRATATKLGEVLLLCADHLEKNPEAETGLRANGYQVVKFVAAPGGAMTRDGRILLLDKGEDDKSPQRWITGLQLRGQQAGDEGPWDSGWTWGHYFDDEQEARKDFDTRCARGY